MRQNQPKIGVGVMIFKGVKVLLAKRKGAHGAGEYAFPGGHLEYMESFESCAKRETMEEVGIEIANIRFQFLANVQKYAPLHYVHLGLIADWQAGVPTALEPESSDTWEWYDLTTLPQPLFEMCKLAVDSFRTGKNYFDL